MTLGFEPEGEREGMIPSHQKPESRLPLQHGSGETGGPESRLPLQHGSGETGGPESRLPLRREKRDKAHVAQAVEHVLGKDGVTSSTLVVGSSSRNRPDRFEE